MNEIATVIPESHKAIRQAIRDFALSDAEPWFKQWLCDLYDAWEKWNESFFESKLVVPCIFISEPKTPRALADCSTISAFGARSQIRIRPSLLTGEHRIINAEAPLEGRCRLIADVVLHEMIHQYQDEITGNPEHSYKGHGSGFRDKCNEIGAALGLPVVRVAKARGKDKDLPSCASWPFNVRPLAYYLGAYVMEQSNEPETDGGESEEGESAGESDPVQELLGLFRNLAGKDQVRFLQKVKRLTQGK